MADTSTENTTTVQRKIPACLRCNTIRKKCEREEGEPGCKLCKTNGVLCQPRTPLKRGRPPRNAGPRQLGQQAQHAQRRRRQQRQERLQQRRQEEQLPQRQQQQRQQRQLEPQRLQQQIIAHGIQQLQLQPEQSTIPLYVQIEPQVVPIVNNDNYNSNVFLQNVMYPQVWYTNSRSEEAASITYPIWPLRRFSDSSSGSSEDAAINMINQNWQPQMPLRRLSDNSNRSLEEEPSSTINQTWPPQTEEEYYGYMPPPPF